ncbi:HEAT repeat protein [Peribacillus deserti]|uniref:HEAT repeat protein n=1 Tax=Peribacillus deserti TaxID=673318 RepID=A0ABS2QEL8_9BACI|nr:HEAT repeat domain-containing protein [Peribacillus deserti]MBM7691584.1 HEAT repeat protein [Peribacillus deserti]
MDELLAQLNKEKNAYKLSVLLEKAGRRKMEDYTAIFPYLSDKRSSVREAAIQALRAYKSSDAEEALIKLITESTDEYDLTLANSVLSEIGTKQFLT